MYLKGDQHETIQSMRALQPYKRKPNNAPSAALMTEKQAKVIKRLIGLKGR